MPSSEGVVRESVLHDGNWHAVVNVKLWAEFRSMYWYTIPKHESWTAMTWYVKVG